MTTSPDQAGTPGTMRVVGRITDVANYLAGTTFVIHVDDRDIRPEDIELNHVELWLMLAPSRIDQAAAQTETTEGFRA
jgi:hypothetical protein